MTPTAIEVVSPQLLRVTCTDIASDPAVFEGANWSLTLARGLGHRPVVIGVERVSSDVFALTIHPQLTPGATYRLKAPDVASPPSGGDEGGGGSVALPPPYFDPSFTVPSAMAPVWRPEARVGVLPVDDLLDVFGRALQRSAGVGASRLLTRWKPGDRRFVLESTLPFPDMGAVYIGPLRFLYGARTEGSLEEVTPILDPFALTPVRAGTIVVSDLSGTRPNDGAPLPPRPPDTPPPSWFRGIAYLDF